MADTEAPPAPTTLSATPDVAPANAPAPPQSPRGETAQVPSVRTQRSSMGQTTSDARQQLREAFGRSRPAPAPAAAREAPADAPEETGATAPDVVGSPQETPAGGPPPAAPASPASSEASDTAGTGAAPAGRPPDGGAGEAGSSPAPERTAAPSSPATQPGTTPPTDEPELPERFLSAEHRALYERDPNLLPSMRRVWRRGDLPEYEKGIRLTGLVDTAAQRIQEAENQAAYRRRLRQEGRLAEWADAEEAVEQEQAQGQEYAQAVSRIMAAAYGVDPDDPGYVNAGVGNTAEERVANFAAWAEEHSPRNQGYVDRRLTQVRAEYEGRIATMQAEHEAQLKELRSRLGDEAEATAAEREAQARGGIRPPPRQGNGTAPGTPGLGPSGNNWDPRALPRNFLAEGFRQHRVRDS